MARILTLTPNPTVDFSWEVDRLTSGGKTRATTLRVSGGGGGINVARLVTELGGAATAVFTAGGAVGRQLRELIEHEPFHGIAVDVSGETRTAVVLVERATGHNYHVVPEGPELTPQEGNALLEVLDAETAGGDLLVVSGSPPPGVGDDFYARVARSAASRGARLLLDTSGAALQQVLEDDVDVFLLRSNHKEASALVGTDVESFDDARDVNDRLIARGAAEVVVTTLGELGCLCTTDAGHTEIHAPPRRSPARSDAGAGDSLMAGIALALSRGDDVVEACRLGVAAAAAAVLTAGASPPDRDEIESLRRDVTTVGADRAPRTG